MTHTYEKFLVSIIRWGSALILAIPLFVFGRVLYPFIFIKIISFQTIVEIIFAAWLILFFYTRKYKVDIKNPLILTLTIFIGVLVSSVFTGVDGYSSFWSTQERMTGVLTMLHFWAWFIVLTSVFKEWKDWKRFLTITLSISFIISIYGFMQKLGWIGETNGSFRISATLGNPIYLAVYSMLHIFLAGFLIFENWFSRKWPYILLILVNTIVIFLTASRGVTIASTLALMIFFAFLAFQMKIKRKMLISFLVILCIFSATIFYATRTDFGKVLIKKSPSVVQKLLTLDLAKEERIRVWNMAWEGFKQKPITGWGWRNFNIVANQYLDDTFSEQWYDYSHNQVMDLLVMTGIVGTLAYLIFYLTIFVSIFKVIKIKKTRLTQSDERKREGRGAQFSIIAGFVLFLLFFTYFLQNLVIFDSPAPLIVFYFMTAFIYFYTKTATQNSQITETRKNKDLLSPKIRFPRLLTSIIILIFLIFALFYFNINPTRASMAGVRAKYVSQVDLVAGFEDYKRSLSKPSFTNGEIRTLLATTVSEHIPPRDENEQKIFADLFNFATSEMKKSIEEHPQDVRGYLYLGGLYNLAAPANPDFAIEAEIALKKAAELSPKRHIIYAELARAASFKKDSGEVIQQMQKATELNPKSAELHWDLAMTLLAEGNYLQGLTEVEKAKELGYSIYQDLEVGKQLATAYFIVGQYSQSLEFVNEGIKKNPADYNLLAQRIILYEKLGMMDLAQKELDSFRINYPNLVKDFEDKLKNTYQSKLK